MNELVFVIKDAAEGGYTARALGQSIVTEADDIEALHRNVREAVHSHFEDAAAPKVVRLRFVREGVIAG